MRGSHALFVRPSAASHEPVEAPLDLQPPPPPPIPPPPPPLPILVVDGFSGDNIFDFRSWSGIRINASGGRGNDLIYGTPNPDSLYGNQDDDGLFGGKGDDTIDGGSGHDVVVGGPGSDLLSGGEGDDLIVIGAGDLVYGGTGADVFAIDASGSGRIVVDDFHPFTEGDSYYVSNLRAEQTVYYGPRGILILNEETGDALIVQGLDYADDDLKGAPTLTEGNEAIILVGQSLTADDAHALL